MSYFATARWDAASLRADRITEHEDRPEPLTRPEREADRLLMDARLARQLWRECGERIDRACTELARLIAEQARLRAQYDEACRAAGMAAHALREVAR